MAKAVAKKGDVIPIPGTTPYPPATSGAWIPMPVEYKTHKKLTIKGVETIYEASCKFMFVGVDPTPKPVNGDEEVVLKAQPTMLKDNDKDMLLMGDEEVGQYGNKLKVVAPNMLKTKPA